MCQSRACKPTARFVSRHSGLQHAAVVDGQPPKVMRQILSASPASFHDLVRNLAGEEILVSLIEIGRSDAEFVHGECSVSSRPGQNTRNPGSVQRRFNSPPAQPNARAWQRKLSLLLSARFAPLPRLMLALESPQGSQYFVSLRPLPASMARSDV